MSVVETEGDPRYGEEPPPRYYGKYAGLVLDNDPPPSGGHRGRVQVQVPGILEETPNGEDNRALEVLADPAFLPGFFFVPDKQDRVWVEFVAGDINHPIWTGVWYPEDKSPKTAAGGAPTLDQKVIRTRSGQVVQLDDTAGGEQLVIKDEKNGNTITLDKEGINIEGSASGKGVTLTFGGTTVVVKDDAITLTKGKSTVILDSQGVGISDTTGTAQAVVLQPFADWITQTFVPWALAHMHTGNLGAPTSPPLPPPPAPAMPDRATGASKSS